MSHKALPFSVVMPVYKGDQPEHVSTAIESLFHQTLRANEVVLIQDGPIPEKLAQVVEHWKGKMPELNHVVLEVNQGLSAALNAGISAASNEWLARMDADDICKPSRFEKQMAVIANNPDVTIMGSWITEYDEDMVKQVGERRLPQYHNAILAYAKWRCPFNHMTVMYKKSLVEALGKYKNFGAVGDDYELWARFLVNGYKGYNIQESLVDARTGKDFFSNRRRGVKYFKNEVKELNELYRIGLINAGHYFVHYIIKAIIRLSPPFFIKIIYKSMRKNS